MKKTMQISGFVSLAVFSTSSVFSQEELSLDALLNVKVQSAGFFAESAEKSTGHAYVYDRAYLNRYNLKSMDELLEKYVPGMAIGTHKMTGGQVLTRGLDTPSRLLFLADGDNINRRTGYGRMYTDIANPLMGDLDSVEVILGPGALVHGTGALNGFVNMISPTGETRPGIWSKLANPMIGANTAEVSWGQAFSTARKSNVFLYAGLAESKGVKPTYNYNTNSMSVDSGTKNGAGTPDVVLTNLPTSTNGVAGQYRADFRNQQLVNYMPETNWKTLARYVNGSDSDFFKLDAKVRFEKTARDTGAPTWARSRGNAWEDGKASGGNGPCSDGYAPICVYNSMSAKDKSEANSGLFYIENTSLTANPNVALNFNSANNLEISPYFHVYQTVLKPFEWSKSEFMKSGRDMAEMKNSGNAEMQAGTKIIYRNKMIANNGLAAGLDVSSKRFSGEKPFIFSGQWNVPTEMNNSFSWKEMAFFAEDVYSMGDATFSAGLRYDKATFGELAVDDDYSNKDAGWASVRTKFVKTPTAVSAPTYRLASTYKISDSQNVKFSYQTGFHFPDAGNYRWLYLKNAALDNAGLSSLKFPDLKPEKSQSIEVNYVKKFKEYNIALDVTAFYSQYKDMISWVQLSDTGADIDGKWKAVKDAGKDSYLNGWWGTNINSSKTFKAAGIETGLIYKKNNVDASVWYSTSRPIGDGATSIGLARADQKKWTTMSEHTVKSTAAYNFGDVTLSGLLFWRSGIKYNPNGANQLEHHRYLDTKQVRLDVNAIYNVTKTLSITAFVNNLTDNKMGRVTPNYDGYDPIVGAQYSARTFGTNLVASF